MIKPGTRTSELGVLGLVSGLIALNDELAQLAPHELYTIAAIASVYIVSRTALKIFGAKYPALQPERKDPEL